MSDYIPSDKVATELDKVNKVWDNLITNVHGKENIIRVRILLTQVMIEYYLDRVLLINNVDSKENIQNMRFDQILEKLKKIKLINSVYENDCLRIYKIRNIYAHEIEIHQRQVLDLINGIKSIQDVPQFKKSERIEKILEIILRQTQRLFMETLVREEEKNTKS